MKVNTTVHDVASYVLQKKNPVTAMKLQKLVYYCQAWSLVWEDKPIFNERIECWARGPILPTFWKAHKGQYSISSWPLGDIKKLDKDQKETVDAVLDFYGGYNSQWLSDLSCMEDPWRDARKGISDKDINRLKKKVITHASMCEYYASLPPED